VLRLPVAPGARGVCRARGPAASRGRLATGSRDSAIPGSAPLRRTRHTPRAPGATGSRSLRRTR